MRRNVLFCLSGHLALTHAHAGTQTTLVTHDRHADKAAYPRHVRDKVAYCLY